MKISIKVLIISVLVILFQNTYAQKAKYGHTNSDSVLMKMPELKEADLKLKTLVSELETEIIEMNTQYETLVTAYNENETGWSDLIKQNKLDEISSLNERITQFRTSAQEEIQTKKLEIYTPILEKFNNAVKEVAQENGYKMIFDRSKGFLLYYDDSDDVTGLIEKKLGIVE